MSQDEKRLRADAERNRRRVLDAAAELFVERGLDVGVGEIAERAGVGRGTLFRNFASKEDLIAAIVVDRMADASAHGRALLDSADPAEALFDFLHDMVGRQQLDRSLFEAVSDTWLANDSIRAAHAEVLEVVDQLLTRAKDSGEVREDVGALDVLMLFKGVCESATALGRVDPGIVERHLDLVRAALSTSAATQPLRGREPSLADLELSARD
jgi:AcrR family transcriptional regulator